jgi:hypothetical protein
MVAADLRRHSPGVLREVYGGRSVQERAGFDLSLPDKTVRETANSRNKEGRLDAM